MEVVSDLAVLPRLAGDGGAAVTIGAYDGVHLGHQAVLRELRRRASVADLSTAVVTFDRHPASVVRPESAPKLLTDLEQKLEVLAATGDVDMAVVVTFDVARSQEEPEEFVREILVEGLAARVVVVGADFHFGRRRRGNVELLRRLGEGLGFEVVGLGLVDVPGVPGVVSSTAIRTAVAAGDVTTASQLLGRPFELRGVVVIGDRRGRELGYPTANVRTDPEMLVPGEGVYAGWYERPDGEVHAAAIGVGRRPTFGDGTPAPIVEAYLLDFEGDLYGEPARVRFVSRLRDDVRFPSVEELVAQMDRDVDATRLALTGRRP
ncbi:MAG: bifunctional riboflavin kinase/FAD synthetase [Actinomycetota bacterium]|nr:bifunctional riboflavin kinase/FAD synthetase [Actinomycetota bacterium]